MTGAKLGLPALLDELAALAMEAGAASLAERATHAKGAFSTSLEEAPAGPDRRGALVLMLAAALTAGIEARRSSAELSSDELSRRLEQLREPGGHGADAAALLEQELERIKDKVRLDVVTFKEDVRRELPGAVREASLDELKRHFPAFVESTFGKWLEAELAEVEGELQAVAERTEALLREAGARVLRPSVLPELGVRALEVDSFPRDFGVFALGAVGLAVLFSNALLGGALLVVAPVVARAGREKTLIELRLRAAEEATRALSEATERLERELLARIDGFGAELLAVAVGPEAPARRGIADMLERALAERGGGSPGAEEISRCQGWQERLTGLLARLQALEPAFASERIRS